MTIQQTPAPARSDLRADPTRLDAGLPGTGPVSPVGSRRPYAVHGTVLAVGAFLWAVASALTGASPEPTGTEVVIFGIGSGAFQVGLMFLLRALWRSQALGTGRLARFFLRLEVVLVSVAMLSTFVDAIQVSDLNQPGWLVIDLFWPLSMMGMFAIGIRIAIAGRWRGASRYWPMVAESWAVVVIPTFGLFGYGVATVVATVHLLLGYTVLGVLVARKDG